MSGNPPVAFRAPRLPPSRGRSSYESGALAQQSRQAAQGRNFLALRRRRRLRHRLRGPSRMGAQMSRAARPTRAARGYDGAWFKVRGHHLKYFPFCVICARMGRQVRGEHVDHIITVRENPLLRLDPRNLQTLCAKHHAMITAAFDSGDLRGACDEFGQPLDPRHPWAQISPEMAMETVNAPIVEKRFGPPGLGARLKRATVKRI